MYFLMATASTLIILFIAIYVDPKSRSDFKWKRFKIGLIGMLFVQLIFHVISFVVMEYFWSDLGKTKTGFFAIEAFSILLALWATRHIRKV